MSDQPSSKPQKKGIARKTDKTKSKAQSKARRTTTTSKKASSHKSSRNPAPDSDNNEAEDDKQSDEDEAEVEGPQKTKSKASSKPSANASETIEDVGEERFDRSYVEAHKDTEDFHHRGKGDWLRGLPAPGSKNRGVEGPEAAAWKAANQQGGKK